MLILPLDLFFLTLLLSPTWPEIYSYTLTSNYSNFHTLRRLATNYTTCSHYRIYHYRYPIHQGITFCIDGNYHWHRWAKYVRVPNSTVQHKCIFFLILSAYLQCLKISECSEGTISHRLDLIVIERPEKRQDMTCLGI